MFRHAGGPDAVTCIVQRCFSAVMFDPDIEAYYRLGLECGRLREDGGALEFVRTRELLGRFLPRPPAIVIDVGGGAGAYAVPLAAAGYEIHLLDPVALHVEQALTAAHAEDTALAGAVVGDARRLPYPDATAHAVLLLGPLYHLTARPDRLAALRQARRVLRPGGVLLAAAVSRFASTFDGLARGVLVDQRFEDIVERDLRDGQHRNPDPDARPEWFTTAYFHRPDELRHELEETGFDVEAVLAVEGPAAFRPQLDAWLADRTRKEALLRAIGRVEAEPSLLGASAHLLAVGRWLT
jgi:ubiquinone/menaquinone biosynthesis C-methylase UbiE